MGRRSCYQSISRNQSLLWRICSHNPYFPYDQELFGHDEDNTPDLQDDWSYLSSLHKGQKCYTVYLLVKIHYCFPPLMMMFWKEDSPCFLLKRRFSMIPRLLVTPKSPWPAFTIHCTIHYSLLLFIVLFTQIFCLFKGSCPLSLGQNSTTHKLLYLEFYIGLSLWNFFLLEAFL